MEVAVTVSITGFVGHIALVCVSKTRGQVLCVLPRLFVSYLCLSDHVRVLVLCSLLKLFLYRSAYLNRIFFRIFFNSQ